MKDHNNTGGNQLPSSRDEFAVPPEGSPLSADQGASSEVAPTSDDTGFAANEPAHDSADPQRSTVPETGEMANGLFAAFGIPLDAPTVPNTSLPEPLSSAPRDEKHDELEKLLGMVKRSNQELSKAAKPEDRRSLMLTTCERLLTGARCPKLADLVDPSKPDDHLPRLVGLIKDLRAAILADKPVPNLRQQAVELAFVNNGGIRSEAVNRVAQLVLTYLDKDLR